MVDIQTISVAIASTSVVAGVIYYAFQVRHQTKIRKTDLVLKLFSTWESKEFSEATLKVWNLEFKDYDDFVKKCGPWYSETEVYIAIRMVGNFFMVLGNLLSNKLVDIDMVTKTFGFPIKATWEKIKPLVEGARKTLGPTFTDAFEYLYDEIQKREQRLQQSTA